MSYSVQHLPSLIHRLYCKQYRWNRTELFSQRCDHCSVTMTRLILLSYPLPESSLHRHQSRLLKLFAHLLWSDSHNTLHSLRFPWPEPAQFFQFQALPEPIPNKPYSFLFQGRNDMLQCYQHLLKKHCTLPDLAFESVLVLPDFRLYSSANSYYRPSTNEKRQFHHNHQINDSHSHGYFLQYSVLNPYLYHKSSRCNTILLLLRQTHR